MQSSFCNYLFIFNLQFSTHHLGVFLIYKPFQVLALNINNRFKLSREIALEKIKMRIKDISREKKHSGGVVSSGNVPHRFLYATCMGEMGTDFAAFSNLQVIIRLWGAASFWNIPGIITLTSSGEI